MTRTTSAALAAALGIAALASVGCTTHASAATATAACEATRSQHADTIARGEDAAGRASSLAAGGRLVTPGSPEREQYDAAMRESLVREIPVYARIATATECYSDDEVVDAQQRLVALADNLARYAE